MFQKSTNSLWNVHTFTASEWLPNSMLVCWHNMSVTEAANPQHETIKPKQEEDMPTGYFSSGLEVPPEYKYSGKTATKETLIYKQTHTYTLNRKRKLWRYCWSVFVTSDSWNVDSHCCRGLLDTPTFELHFIKCQKCTDLKPSTKQETMNLLKTKKNKKNKNC